jgi:hypothetical protein
MQQNASSAVHRKMLIVFLFIPVPRRRDDAACRRERYVVCANI